MADASALEDLLMMMKGEFFNANLALLSFDEASTVLDAAMNDWNAEDENGELRRLARQREIEREMSLATGMNPYALSGEDRENFHEQARLRCEREMQGTGLPLAFLKRKPFLFARAFVYALDSFSKALKALLKVDGSPANLAALQDKLLVAFPDLLAVRDTAHHAEDRARGLDRRGNPLTFQPIKTAEIHAPEGLLVIDTLIHTRYSCTMNDGRLGEVDVSETSLRSAHEILEEVLRSFAWHGQERSGLS